MMWWPFIAFAAVVVIVLVWLDGRLGTLPEIHQVMTWIKPLPCGCIEYWRVDYVRYSAHLIWASTRVCIRPSRFIMPERSPASVKTREVLPERSAAPALAKTRELMFDDQHDHELVGQVAKCRAMRKALIRIHEDQQIAEWTAKGKVTWQHDRAMRRALFQLWLRRI